MLNGCRSVDRRGPFGRLSGAQLALIGYSSRVERLVKRSMATEEATSICLVTTGVRWRPTGGNGHLSTTASQRRNRTIRTQSRPT
jgi:hypothetical protein